MEFRILGPLEAFIGERSLPLGSEKQRALLAILLLDGNRTVSRDRLIDGLWGAEPPAKAAQSIQTYVWRLRKLLPPDMLRTRLPGYVLLFEPDQLDLHRFERLCAEGRESVAHGDARAASACFHEALALWRGPALAEFASEPFVQSEGPRLEELRLAALEDRIEADLALGRDGDLVAELEALAARYPFRERLRGQLMLALYRSGRQAEALSVYQATRSRFVAELGIEPGRRLQELEQAVLRQDPSLDSPPEGGSEATPQPTASGRANAEQHDRASRRRRRLFRSRNLMAVTAVILVAVAAAAITLWQNGSPGAKAGSPDSQAATRADGSRVPYAEQIAGGSSDVASIVLPEETLLPEFWEAYGAGDAARAAAFFTEDGIWIMADPVGTSVAGGRDAFALVGRDAIEVALAHYCCGGVQPTALDLGVVGETLAGRARLGDAIHAFTAELRDGKFSSLRETLDLADPATALGYEAKWYFWQRPYSPKPSDLVVSLEAADDSGPVGRVLLSEASAGWPPAAEAGTSPVDRVTQVHIDVEPGTGGVHRLVHQPVRIHIGSCSDLGPVIHPLASIVDGTSDSLVSARVDDLLNGERSVALYKSDEEPEALIACGNLTDLT